MKTYGITIQPTSPFGTPLKGDTIFGHFCWQTADDPSLLNGGLHKWLDCYHDTPFAVFSSAWPVLQYKQNDVYAIARPLGLQAENKKILSRREKIIHNKVDKKRKWLIVESSLKINLTDQQFKTDKELFDLFLENTDQAETKSLRLLAQDQQKLCIPVNQPHNSINRLTMTTGTGEFAPFSHDNFQFIPGLCLIIFAAVQEHIIDENKLRTAFERIGNWGYGRDASAGLGRFTVKNVTELNWPDADDSDSACYTLGPTVPQKETFSRCYATPFTRFGKHGASLATSANPFKQPVVMADEGAVFYPIERDVFSAPYIGTAVKNVSTVDKQAVVQGYSLYLPC